MDISFKTDEGRFNYRVAAVIIRNGKLLVMRDNGISHYYLPGGRVRMHETAENAVMRELSEELRVKSEIIRPLWIVQSYFALDGTEEKFHEICIYYLMDISASDIISRGEFFKLKEGKVMHEYEWIEFDRLEELYFYPLFLKKAVFDLPEHLTMLTEIE